MNVVIGRRNGILTCLNVKQNKTFAISEEDEYVLDLATWSIDLSDGYVKGRVDGKIWRLHRYLLRDELSKPSERKLVVDHKNRDKTACYRSNLIVCTQRENQRNQKAVDDQQYIGIYRKGNKWVSRVKFPQGFNIAYMYTKRRAAIMFDIGLYKAQGSLNGSNFTSGRITEEEILEEGFKLPLSSNLFEGDHLKTPTGIQRKKNRFLAFLTILDKYTYIGSFKTEYDAILAREERIIKEKSNSISNFRFLKREDQIRLFGKDIIESDT